MTTTTRFVDVDGTPVLPGVYNIVDTRVCVTAVTRPDGFTVGEQSAVIFHTVTPQTCLHCGDPAEKHSDDRQACVKAGYWGNRYTPATTQDDTPNTDGIDTLGDDASGPVTTPTVSPEQALTDIRAAFDACFTPDFNGVDWRNDEAIQALAATVYPIIYRTTQQ